MMKYKKVIKVRSNTGYMVRISVTGPKKKAVTAYSGGALRGYLIAESKQDKKMKH